MSHLPQSIDDGIWRWTARHPEWHPGEWGAEVAGFALVGDGLTLLVDPLLPGGVEDAETIAALDAIVDGDVAIVVSNPYHTRSSEPLAERYGATIYGHAAVRKRLSSSERFWPVDETSDGLPGGVRFFAVGKPRRHEQPIWIPAHRALVFGDSVVTDDRGKLRVWDNRPEFVREKLNPTLRPLADLGAERVLVTHGEPILHDGTAELRRALRREPFWHRA
jgi:glyoxylase-like metal-dependent hydrolase (beta-lactamase superfamily II)